LAADGKREYLNQNFTLTDGYIGAALELDEECVSAWALHCIMALTRGQRSEAGEAGERLLHLFAADPTARSRVYRELERIQGGVRVQFQSLLLRLGSGQPRRDRQPAIVQARG
jgi:hypothetical protein